MGSGGFHGGGGHIGGHHGGFGGFGGGGFGGFGGGGFGGFGGGSHGGFGGGGSHYHGGGGYFGGSNNHDDEDMGQNMLQYFYFCLVITGLAVFVTLFVEVGEGGVQGFNYTNLTIFAVSVLFFVLGLKDSGRTSILKEFKKGYLPTVYGCLWKGDYAYKRVGDSKTWYDSVDKKYRIAFYDREYGVENARKVKETIDRTPKIFWVLPGKWLLFGIISFVSSFFFYELVIPIFEQATMTDQAFAFIDEFVFYFPSVICLLCSLACFILVKVRDNLLYKCAQRAVEDNKAAEERKQTESLIASKLSEKWFYNICPNCGASASKALQSWSCCGTSLEVRNFDFGMKGSVHRISTESGKTKEKRSENG